MKWFVKEPKSSSHWSVNVPSSDLTVKSFFETLSPNPQCEIFTRVSLTDSTTHSIPLKVVKWSPTSRQKSKASVSS